MADNLYTVTVNGLDETSALAIAERIPEEIDESVAASVNENDSARGRWNLIAYCRNEEQAISVRNWLLAHESASRVISIERLEPFDWVRDSLKRLPPVSAGRFFVHGAHDRARRRPGGIGIEIDAATAFGTGHHGTTRGCLLALDRLLKQRIPRSVLDVGCGTGILAIAAARASRRRALASDIDGEAVQVARSNARLNNVLPWVGTYRAEATRHRNIIGGAPYDLVFANILAAPLIGLAPELSRCVSSGGHLVLSGLTRDQERAVRAAYRNRGMVSWATWRLGDWVTMMLRK